MTDRELLELAAKAAGYMPNNNWAWSERAQAFRYRLGGDWIEWNPRDDDGDALRLAVKLFDGDDMEVIWHNARRLRAECPELDEVAAIRHAIFHAAADIGRNMP